MIGNKSHAPDRDGVIELWKSGRNCGADSEKSGICGTVA